MAAWLQKQIESAEAVLNAVDRSAAQSIGDGPPRALADVGRSLRAAVSGASLLSSVTSTGGCTSW